MSDTTKANSRQVGGDHYKTGGTELWGLFGPDALAFYAARYVQRWRRKNGVVDLEKAVHVCEKLREVITQRSHDNHSTGEDYLYYHVADAVEGWLRNSGMDWVECSIARKLLYWEHVRDVTEAIEGIRYLIASASPEKQLERHAGAVKTTGAVKSKSYAEMTDDELMIELVQLKTRQEQATGWGAAVGARDEYIKEIESEQARRMHSRDRRVPRYDADVKHSSADALSGHYGEAVRPPSTTNDVEVFVSSTPWTVSLRWLSESGVDPELAGKFWSVRAPGLHVLEPHVVSTSCPRILREFYHLRGDGNWTLAIRKCPPEVRDYFPNLIESMHMKQWEDETPEWQRVLYTWSNEKNKYELTDMTAAWHVESELEAHYKTMEDGHG